MQPSLFDPPLQPVPFDDPPSQRHSSTSQAAAERAKPIAGAQRRLVLLLIQESGETGMTDEEIQRAGGMNPSGARPRRVELVRAGLVRDSGRTRKTASGRLAVVWVATGKQS